MERNVPLGEGTMKKKRILRTWISLLVIVCLCCGCGSLSFGMEDRFEDYYARTRETDKESEAGMAEDLAVLSPEEDKAFGMQTGDYADLLINDSTNTVITSYHCFDKLYPASITKIMTALLTLEKGDLSNEITLEHNTSVTEDGAVVSTLVKGDTVTVGEVLKTMLVKSANDCAVILAEYIAGSTEKFADMMNARAKELGATHTHFVNPNGLHDDNHYTTAYDLYLIFREVTGYDTFVDIVSMKDNTMVYKNKFGQEVHEYMQTTNHFLLNEYPLPEGVVMYGGKTGTTSMANSCLILLTENADGERFFSVVLGARTKPDLYRSMTELLQKTTK